MKKQPAVLTAILFVLLLLAGCACAGSSQTQELKIQVSFSTHEVKALDTVKVKISLTNISGKDFAGPMTLYDPFGLQVREFGHPVLKNGETASWSGRCLISEKSIEAAAVTYKVEFAIETENGKVVNKRVNLRQAITPLQPDPTPVPTPEPKPEDFDDVLLYGVYRPNPSTGWVSVGCVDSGGNIWLAEKADVRWPARDQDVREMLRTRRGMAKYQNLIGSHSDGIVLTDTWFTRDVPDMVAAVPQPAERPRKTGINVGQEAVWGLRKNKNGGEESVLLGMAGSYMYENPSPDAQRLYLFMWRLLANNEIFNARGISYATEGVSPEGFRGIPVREFFGLAEGDLSKASVTASRPDAGGRPAEEELSPQEIEKIRELAERGMVILKENARQMPRDVLTCTFTDEQGKELGQIRLFTQTVESEEGGEPVLRTLAVAEDGMYRTVLAPRPVDTLTKKELRMMTVRIEGVDYIVGKSTPRDLIRHGWTCFPEWTGAFTFEDPEMNNTIEVETIGHSLDEPIVHISCQFAGDLDIEYCGFDGIPDPKNPDDPDWGYYTDEPYEGIQGGQVHDTEEAPDQAAEYDPDDDYAWEKQWIALTEWIHDVLGAGQDTSSPGTSVCIPLSDGRYLYLYSNSSPVSITLSEYGPESSVLW